MPAPHNPFKSALKAGKKQLGIWASLCSPLPDRNGRLGRL